MEIHEQLDRSASRCPGRPLAPTRTPARWLLLAVAILATPAAAHAEPHATSPEPELIALHYEDLLATDPPTVTVVLPPPPVAGSVEARYFTHGCLDLQGALSGSAERAFVLELPAPTAGSCRTTIEIVFSQGDDRWPATAIVNLTRLPPVPELEGVEPTFRTGSTTLPWRPGDGVRTAGMALLGIDNRLPQPLRILGLGDDAAFASLIGPAFRYDPAAFGGSYADLLEGAEPFGPIALAPGEAAHIALVFDPTQRLPSGAGALTVRPVALVEVAGERFTVAFPRVSNTWGVGLP